MPRSVKLNLDVVAGYLARTRFREVIEPADLTATLACLKILGEPVKEADLNESMDQIARVYQRTCYLEARYDAVYEDARSALELREAVLAGRVRRNLPGKPSETEIKQHVRQKKSIQGLRGRFQLAKEVRDLMAAIREGARKRIRILEQISNNFRQDQRAEAD